MADGKISIGVELNSSKAEAEAKGLGNELGKTIDGGVKNATKETKQTVNQAMGEIGAAVTGYGKAWTKSVTLPIVAAGVATGAAAVDIDTALTGVKKTVDGTAEQYEELKQKAIEFSQTNAVDPSQILDIQALGAQLGYSIEELDMFGEVVSGLDIATNMDADTAATELAQFANIVGMAHEDTKRYGSTIVELGNNFATTEADISHMSMRIAAAGKQIGLSEADILGLATALSSMGIEAEAGGTAISTIMSQIDKAVATNSESLADWAAAAGMSSEQFAQAWGDDAVAALSAVLVGMDNAVQSGGNMSVMLDELGISAIRQTDTLKRLASNSEFLGKAVDTANQAWEENTALDKEVENRNASMAAQLEIAANKVRALAIEIGEPLMNALLDIIDTAEPFIQALASGAKAFGDLDEGAQKAVLMAVGVVAAFGPLVTVGGKVITMLSNQGNKWKAFSENLNVVKGAISSNAKAMAAGTTTWTKYIAVGEGASRSFMKWDKATQSYVKTNNKLVGSIATSTVGMRAQAAAQTVSNTAMKIGATVARTLGNVLKTIAPVAILTAAVEIFTALSDAISKSNEAAEKHKKATQGITSSMDAYAKSYSKVADSTSAATTGTQKYVASLAEVKSSIDETIEKQAELSDKLADSWSEVGTNNAMVDQYVATIERLTKGYDKNGNAIKLEAEEQAELQLAVQGLNSIMGTSYSVIDAQRGILSESTSAIVANAEAWKQKAIAEAAAAASADLMKQHLENAVALEKAEGRLTDAQKAYNDAVSAGATDLTPWNDALVDAKAEVDRLTEADQAVIDEMDNINEKAAELSDIMSSSTDALTAYVEATGEWSGTLETAGISADDFVNSLSEIGVSTSTMSQILRDEGQAGIDGFVSAYQSGTDSLIAWLSEKGYQIPATMAESMEAGTPEVEAAAAENVDTAQVEYDSIDTEPAGQSAVDGFVEPMLDTGKVKTASEGQANTAAEGFKSQDDNAGTWGSHLVENFAKGISGAVDFVVGAANTVMSALAGIFQFSVPKKGIWSGAERGGERSGEHLAQNFARGFKSGSDEVIDAVEALEGNALKIMDGMVYRISDKGEKFAEEFVAGFENIDPMAQIEQSLVSGMSAIALQANTGAVGATTNYNTQNNTFNNPVQSPDEWARELRLARNYGLAGRR